MSDIYARCGASNQSIVSGARCRLVMVTQSASYTAIDVTQNDKQTSLLGIANTSVYPDCFWKPKSPFIRAVYDDYGMTELVLETPIDRAQVISLFVDLYQANVVTQKGENQFHDLAFDFVQFVRDKAPALEALFAPMSFASAPVIPASDVLDAELRECWQHLSDMVRRHRVFTRGYNNHVRPLEMFIVHEQAYQSLCAAISKKSTYDGISYQLVPYLHHAIAAAHEEADKRDLVEEGDDEAQKERLHQVAFSETLRGRIERLDVSHCFANSTARRVFHWACSSLYKKEMSTDDFVTKIAPWMQDRLAICAMEMYELKFAPMTYVGEDIENSVGKAYATFVADVSQAITAELSLAR
jgi:hypothetical protein